MVVTWTLPIRSAMASWWAAMVAPVGRRREGSASSGNHPQASARHCSAPSGGLPGVIPAAMAWTKYLRTVLGSKPSDVLSSPMQRPACQCWNSSTTSITLNDLLAI